jgi:hypothetical protein
MTNSCPRDRSRTVEARTATIERRNARRGKRARKFLAFAMPRALELA